MRNHQKFQVISLKSEFFFHSASYACRIMDWKTLISSKSTRIHPNVHRRKPNNDLQPQMSILKIIQLPFHFTLFRFILARFVVSPSAALWPVPRIFRQRIKFLCYLIFHIFIFIFFLAPRFVAAKS